jgi:hypothetical protein
MRNLVVCLVMLSSTAFAEVSLRSVSSEVGQFVQSLKAAGNAACEMKGSTLTAHFEFNGKQVTNAFYLGGRNGVDTSVTVDQESQKLVITQGLLFTSNSLHVTYTGSEVSQVEMVVAEGTAIETTVNCSK